MFRLGRLAGDVRFQIVDVSSDAVLSEDVLTSTELTAKDLLPVSSDVPSALVPDAVPPRRLRVVRQSCQTLLAVGQTDRHGRSPAETGGPFERHPPISVFVCAESCRIPEDPRAFQGVDYILLVDQFGLTDKQATAIQCGSKTAVI